MKLSGLAFILLGLLLLGCVAVAKEATIPTEQTPEVISAETPTPDPTPTISGPAPVTLGEPFTLALGRSATISANNLTVSFDAVIDDSRCPNDVECFWAGEATIVGTLLHNDTLLGEFSLVIFGSNSTDARAIQQVGNFQVELLSLDPQPVTTSTEPLAYMATLRVSMSEATAMLGQPFTVAIGSDAFLADANLIVTFDDVFDDFRCPLDLDCDAPGEATVIGRLLQDGAELGEFSLIIEANDNTYEASSQQVGDYQINIIALAPQPTSERKPPLLDYLATFIVSGDE